jgi:hypothetical protein
MKKPLLNEEINKIRKMMGLNENENAYYDSDPTDGDRDHDMETTIRANDLYDKGLEAYSEGDLLKADRYYKEALKVGSWLGWGEQDLPPYEKAVKGIEETEDSAEEIYNENDFEDDFYKMLNGCEINSLEFEDVVYVDGKNRAIIRNGEKIQPNKEELKTLWREYVQGEDLY